MAPIRSIAKKRHANPDRISQEMKDEGPKRFLVVVTKTVEEKHLYEAASMEEAQVMYRKGFKPLETHTTVVGAGDPTSIPDDPSRRLPMPEEFLAGKPLPYLDERDDTKLINAVCTFDAARSTYTIESRDLKGRVVDSCSLRHNEALLFLAQKVEEWRDWATARDMMAKMRGPSQGEA